MKTSASALLAAAAAVSLVAASPTLAKRDGDCSVQPAGTGPTINGSAINWQAAPYWAANATTVATPDGYTLSFANLNASTQTASYLDYTILSTYDPAICARYCDQNVNCTSFNLYYERDPTLDPNAASCPNPPSLTNIKCARYSSNITAATAVNTGQYRDSFQVVVAGSNGYNKFAPPPAQAGWCGPQELPGAINAPTDPVTGQDTYITVSTYVIGQDVADFDPSVCLQHCQEISTFDLQHPPSTGKPNICHQVVAYVLSGDDYPKSMQCAFYTESWAAQYANNVGYWETNGDFVGVTRAYSYVNATYEAQWGPICAVGGCPSGSYQGGSCGGWGGVC